MKRVEAIAALELLFNLVKANPWLISPGNMTPSDAAAEPEALGWLLAGDLSQEWNGCSPAASRVACSLLLDFMAKLKTPGHPMAEKTWEVMENTPPDRQALALIAAEIRRSHPGFGSIQ